MSHMGHFPVSLFEYAGKLLWAMAFCATLKITTLSRIRKLCFLCLALTVTGALAETNLASRFGFTGPEIFPIDTMLGAAAGGGPRW